MRISDWSSDVCSSDLLAAARCAGSDPDHPGEVRLMQLFLDCDGVLADFDRSAEHILGMPPRAFQKRHGLPAFWKRLAKAGDFYATLPLLPDARHLFQAVAHLHPIIRSEEHPYETQSLISNS